MTAPHNDAHDDAPRDDTHPDAPPAPLAGLRVLDLTRVLAGPTCTQLLGDLGAEVIKIERPGRGDDTRAWGPPYIEGRDGTPSRNSAYYLSANRNKRSVTVDMAHPEGQALIRRLMDQSDILVENFKTGGLAKYGLDYPDVKDAAPHLIYCSITGFGRTGPYRYRAGYDYLAQGMGGIMSLTGEPDGEPMKVGVGISDIVCGLHASSAILAALHRRHATGRGQHIDMALLDSQVSWLTYEGLNYLTSGERPQRRGSEHPNIVPYRTMPCADGYIILAVGNDGQFRKFCAEAGCPDLADDPRYATNEARCANRRPLYAHLMEITRGRTQQDWVDSLSAVGVPCGPVNTVDQVFTDPQVQHREMQVTMPDPDSERGAVDLIGNPIKFSESPVSYRHAPPHLGADTNAVLNELLDLDADARARLRAAAVI